MLHPAPGLITAYDEHACLVVDTTRDEWIHLTGPQAWAWETVQATGSPVSLDQVEQGCIRSFIRYGLLVESDVLCNRFEIPAPKVPTPSEFAEGDDAKRAVKAVRRHAMKLAKGSIGHAMRIVQALHDQQSHLPWATPESAEELYAYAAVKPRRVPAGCHSPRSIALSAVLGAARAGVRLDWVVAYSHEEGEPREWVKTPEIQPGFTPGCLEILEA